MEAPQPEKLLRALKQITENSDDLVQQAIEFICRESGEPLAVSDVAKAVGASRRTLERHFRVAVGATVRQAITQAQLLRAKRLLRGTSLSVFDVALASGFSYADRLAKVFLRVEGMTPSQYRELSGVEANNK